MSIVRRAFVVVVLFVTSIAPPATARTVEVWDLSEAPTVVRLPGADLSVPAIAIAYDASALDAVLGAAPRPGQQTASDPFNVPGPDGQLYEFRLTRTITLGPELQQRWPDVRTFAGVSTGLDGSTFRMTAWSGGFSIVVDGEEGWNIEGTAGPARNVAQLWRHADEPGRDRFVCELVENAERRFDIVPRVETASHGDQLRSLRLAVTGTGEFAQYHGSVAAAELEIIELVNLANEMFERDLALRMVLVDANVYPDPATDPFTNGTSITGLSLAENHDALVAKLGRNGFDLGHVVSQLGSPGWAGLGAVDVQCDRSRKGEGGTFARIPSAFQLREGILHEVGHQLGARHSFNGTAGACGANRSVGSAYEIASGVSIMSYAGICGSEDVTEPRILMYNAGSMEEIQSAIAAAAGCPETVASGNLPPLASAGPDYTIPLETPFVLDGSGSYDPDGGALTYSWEQYDLGLPSPPYGPDTGPLFRNFAPTGDPLRAVPKYSSYRAGTTSRYEFLPTVARTLAFRLVVRDNFVGAGGTAWDTMVITATGAPFRISSPNGGESIPAGAYTDVTWDVGGGSVASDVRILFSDDAGVTWAEVESSTANDGFHSVPIPCSETTSGRIRIEPIGNIFYDISDTDFSITPDATEPVVTCPSPAEFAATGPDGLPGDDPGLQSWAAGASVSDNCDPDPSLTFAAPDVFPVGTTTATFFAVDASNNVGVCNVDVTVTLATDAPVAGARTAFLGAHPNPFNPRTSLRFELASRQHVRLEIFDLRGRRVEILFEGTLGPGSQALEWDARGVSSGVYIARLQTREGMFHRRLALLK